MAIFTEPIPPGEIRERREAEARFSQELRQAVTDEDLKNSIEKLERDWRKTSGLCAECGKLPPGKYPDGTSLPCSDFRGGKREACPYIKVEKTPRDTIV